MAKNKTLRERFQELDSLRSEILDKAYEQAMFTIPSLYPNRYHQGNVDPVALPELYSSKAGNNSKDLANATVNALVPPNDTPFYELHVSEELDEAEADFLREEVVEVERKILDTLQASNLREKVYTALLNSIVMAGSLVQQTEINKFKVYHPAHFLIRRDGDGNPVEYRTVDWVVTELLDDDMAGVAGGKTPHQVGGTEPLYTYIYKDGDKWSVEREFRDIKYETDKSYDENVLPYTHFGWNPVEGEDYARSLVEDNMGTIRSLEMVCKALAEGIAAGSEGRILIDPSSNTTEDDFLGTENWSFVSANPESVGSWQPSTIQTIGVALQAKEVYERELDKNFMTASASDLTGERVTAFQINQVANERTQKQGGTLAVLEGNLRSIVYRTLFLLIDNDEVDPAFKELIDEGAITISIKSGVDAYGRQADVLRMDAVLERASQFPEMVGKLDLSEFMIAYIQNSGLDQERFTKSETQEQQEADNLRRAQAAQQATDKAIDVAGNIAEQQATG